MSTVLILFSYPEFPMLAIPVTYSTVFDVERSESLEVGNALELECKATVCAAPVCGYKCAQDHTGIVRNHQPSAEVLHSGLYSCDTSYDTVHFHVDNKGDSHLNLMDLGANLKSCMETI